MNAKPMLVFLLVGSIRTLYNMNNELDQRLEDSPLPFIMQHVAKISSVRKRVLSLNSLLKPIHGWIHNIDCTLSVGTTHGIMSPEILFYSYFLIFSKC
ncbi:hypothetical protein RJT34_13167 [Clitoria ternatea]|uniref:Uncharacterized protein n=1 Tax=Clitoria ternatea TaxID=43366 RepID=A0AAN9JQF0_CLITE